MTKYKLIKTYPGSPELGTEVEKDKLSKSYYYRDGDKRICVFNDHVEENPEYWEKINEHLWWAVFKQEHIQYDRVYFNSWTPYGMYCIPDVLATHRYFFKTKEEAEYFILTNKPCLSYNDVSDSAINFDEVGVYYKVYTKKLKEIIKSRL